MTGYRSELAALLSLCFSAHIGRRVLRRNSLVSRLSILPRCPRDVWERVAWVPLWRHSSRGLDLGGSGDDVICPCKICGDPNASQEWFNNSTAVVTYKLSNLMYPTQLHGWPREKLGWFSNRTGTSFDDGARKSNNWLDQWQSEKLGAGSRV